MFRCSEEAKLFFISGLSLQSFPGRERLPSNTFNPPRAPCDISPYNFLWVSAACGWHLVCPTPTTWEALWTQRWSRHTVCPSFKGQTASLYVWKGSYPYTEPWSWRLMRRYTIIVSIFVLNLKLFPWPVPRSSSWLGPQALDSPTLWRGWGDFRVKHNLRQGSENQEGQRIPCMGESSSQEESGSQYSSTVWGMLSAHRTLQHSRHA